MDLEGVAPGRINAELDENRYPGLARFAWKTDEGRSSFGIWKVEKLDTKTDMLFVVNTAHNERNDRTTWQWFHAPRPGAKLGHGMKFKIDFLDSDMKVISHDSFTSFDDLDGGLTSTSNLPIRTLFPVFVNGENHEEVIAIFGPYFFEREGATYDISKYMNLYGPSLVLKRQLTFTPGELQRIASTRCHTSSD